MRLAKRMFTFGDGTFLSELRAKVTEASFGETDIGTTTETYSEEALEGLLA